MPEKFGGRTPEQMGIISKEQTEKEKQEKEDLELLELFKKDHPEAMVVPEKNKEGEAEMAEFRNAVDAFEAKHDMDALFAISDISVAEIKTHPIREPARVDLAAIFDLKKKVEGKRLTNEQQNEVYERWKRISQAVGMINSGKVDHTR